VHEVSLPLKVHASQTQPALAKEQAAKDWGSPIFLPIFSVLCRLRLSDKQNTKFKKEPNATSSNIGHSVIGHWSLTQLGNQKHVANLAKLTNLAKLQSRFAITDFSHKKGNEIVIPRASSIEHGYDQRDLACGTFTH
jgi:hypothetical protein